MFCGQDTLKWLWSSNSYPSVIASRPDGELSSPYGTVLGFQVIVNFYFLINMNQDMIEMICKDHVKEKIRSYIRQLNTIQSHF